jgi:hypothetical protein
LFQKGRSVSKQSNDSYLFTGAAGAANMISVMAVVDCCWKQKNRGNSAKKIKWKKERQNVYPTLALAVPINPSP